MALLENEKSYEIKITVADLEGKEILYGNGCFTELLNELGIKVITEKELDNND